MNSFIKEAVEVLANYNKTTNDVLWVGEDCRHVGGGKGQCGSWNEFVTHFTNSCNVNHNTVIVGDGWWMSVACDEDGRYWMFHQMPLPATDKYDFDGKQKYFTGP